jgi:hypothetical protein
MIAAAASRYSAMRSTHAALTLPLAWRATRTRAALADAVAAVALVDEGEHFEHLVLGCGDGHGDGVAVDDRQRRSEAASPHLKPARGRPRKMQRA